MTMPTRAPPATAPPVVIIAGPTASGKSRLALALAEEFRGTIVNADSQQIYRDLPILSARPDATAEARVPHRLYGFLDAAERGSVARWRELAEAEIAGTTGAGRLPLLVGGSGLYLRALRHGLASVPETPEEVRAEAVALYQELGGAGFRDRLAVLDPEAAARLPAGDRQRLTRAWEVVQATGVPLYRWQRGTATGAPNRFATILLMPPRDVLYAACDARFAAMVAAGALDEVRSLAARGLSPELPAMKGLGVRELLAHLRGEIPLDEAVAAGQRATRRYAKRQMTWFRHQIAAEMTIEQQYSPASLPDVARFIGEFRLTGR
jgi:tRNA dimethylallyltransferase